MFRESDLTIEDSFSFNSYSPNRELIKELIQLRQHKGECSSLLTTNENLLSQLSDLEVSNTQLRAQIEAKDIEISKLQDQYRSFDSDKETTKSEHSWPSGTSLLRRSFETPPAPPLFFVPESESREIAKLKKDLNELCANVANFNKLNEELTAARTQLSEIQTEVLPPPRVPPRKSRKSKTGYKPSFMRTQENPNFYQ